MRKLMGACMRKLLGASMWILGACMGKQLGAKYADVGCKSMERLGACLTVGSLGPGAPGAWAQKTKPLWGFKKPLC